MEELKQLLLVNIENDCWFAIRDKLLELGLVGLVDFHASCLDRTLQFQGFNPMSACDLVRWAQGKGELSNCDWEEIMRMEKVISG